MNTRSEASARWLSMWLFLAANFREFYEYELRRILIPRTPVNKGKKEGRHVPARHPKLLVAGKRSQDIDFVLGGDRHQSLHVGWLRWRYAQLLGWFAHFHGEPLEACRVVLEEYPGLLRSVYLEAVGDPARPVDERPSPRFHPLLSDVEGHLALHDVEGLVLVAVHVVRRGKPARKNVIDEAEGAAGLLAGRLHLSRVCPRTTAPGLLLWPARTVECPYPLRRLLRLGHANPRTLQ